MDVLAPEGLGVDTLYGLGLPGDIWSCAERGKERIRSASGFWAGGGAGDVRGALVWLPDVGVGGVLGLVRGPCGGGGHGREGREGDWRGKGVR